MHEDTVDQALVQALRARNVDVITALDAGMIEREDAEHLDYATEQGCVLCTFNVGDFYGLHSEYVARGKPHAGVILMRHWLSDAVLFGWGADAPPPQVNGE